MAIAPVGTIPSWITSAVKPAGAQVGAGEAIGATSGQSFGNALVQNLQSVDAAQTNADSMAGQLATGQVQDVSEYMIASTEASVATELTVAVRNKAVEAFNEIMRMQI
jgi:flagellar hook-basal body complex protein FliE